MGEKKRRMHVKHVFMRPRMLRRDGYRVKIESFTGITIYRVWGYGRLLFEIYERHQFDACVFVLTKKTEVACKNALVSPGRSNENLTVYCELSNGKIIKLLAEEEY